MKPTTRSLCSATMPMQFRWRRQRMKSSSDQGNSKHCASIARTSDMSRRIIQRMCTGICTPWAEFVRAVSRDVVMASSLMAKRRPRWRRGGRIIAAGAGAKTNLPPLRAGSGANQHCHRGGKMLEEQRVPFSCNWRVLMFRRALCLLLATSQLLLTPLYVCTSAEGRVRLDGGAAACTGCRPAAHNFAQSCCSHRAACEREGLCAEGVEGMLLVERMPCGCKHEPLGEASQPVSRVK